MMEVWCEVCNRLMVEHHILLDKESYDVHVCINCEARIRIKEPPPHECLNTMMEGTYECDVCYPQEKPVEELHGCDESGCINRELNI